MDDIQRLGAFAERYRVARVSPPEQQKEAGALRVIAWDSPLGGPEGAIVPLDSFMHERPDFFVRHLKEGFEPRLLFTVHRLHVEDHASEETSLFIPFCVLEGDDPGVTLADALQVYDTWGRVPDQTETVGMKDEIGALRRENDVLRAQLALSMQKEIGTLRRENAALRGALHAYTNIRDAIQLGQFLLSRNVHNCGVLGISCDIPHAEDVHIEDMSVTHLQRVSFLKTDSSFELSPERGAVLALVMGGTIAAGLRSTPLSESLTIKTNQGAILFPPLMPTSEPSPLILTALEHSSVLLIDPLATQMPLQPAPCMRAGYMSR